MKKLFLIWSVLLCTTALAEEIGRLNLVLPKGEWVLLYTKDAPLGYGGDVQGAIKSKITAKALVDKDKNLIALLTVHGGGAGVAASMSWSEGCKANGREYLNDATKGSFSLLDCLKVWPQISMVNMLRNQKEAQEMLIEKGIKYVGNAYFILDRVGTSNGTFASVSALIVHPALSNIPDAAKDGKYADRPGVAWGQQLADAVRASARSMSGELVVPQIDYR